MNDHGIIVVVIFGCAVFNAALIAAWGKHLERLIKEGSNRD